MAQSSVNNESKAHLEQIFQAGLQRVDSKRVLLEHVSVKGGQLAVQFEDQSLEINLAPFQSIFVLGSGKASARMAQAMEEILGDRLTGGIVATKYGHAEPLQKLKLIEAGHPLPDENSLRAGQEIRQLCRTFDEKSLVINLISGGGSALLEVLTSYEGEGESIRLTLEDLRQTTGVLLACGATINEINCLRKHLSAVKGGQLLRLIQPARSVNLVLSDVVGDRLEVIASGLTVADSSTFHDALGILERYAIEDKLPQSVSRIIRLGAGGKIPETPKPGDVLFSNTSNLLVGTNRQALAASAGAARRLGYNTLVLTSQLVGEAREVAKMLLGIAREVRRQEMPLARPACLIAGGETTVTLHGSGMGGRNQEMALSFLVEMSKDPDNCTGIYFLAASTDGGDGPTDAAGAFASLELIQQAGLQNLDLQPYLQNNDAYHFFELVGGLYKTGPTKTNVCDIQIVIIR